MTMTIETKGLLHMSRKRSNKILKPGVNSQEGLKSNTCGCLRISLIRSSLERASRMGDEGFAAFVEERKQKDMEARPGDYGGRVSSDAQERSIGTVI